MQELIGYRKFPTAVDAEIVAEQLRVHGITCYVIKLQAKLAAIYIGTEYTEPFELQIPQERFRQANQILFSEAAANMQEVDPHHPLLALNDDELRSVISKPDEWGPENYAVALALLKNRGVSISEAQLGQMQEQRINTLSERKPMPGYVLFIGYACVFMPFWLNGLHYYHNAKMLPVWYFPGFFGMIIGAVIISAKTTLPDGRRISTFDNSTVRHGIAILGMNILAWIINALFLAFIVL